MLLNTHRRFILLSLLNGIESTVTDLGHSNLSNLRRALKWPILSVTTLFTRVPVFDVNQDIHCRNESHSVCLNGVKDMLEGSKRYWSVYPVNPAIHPIGSQSKEQNAVSLSAAEYKPNEEVAKGKDSGVSHIFLECQVTNYLKEQVDYCNGFLKSFQYRLKMEDPSPGPRLRADV